jgi:central glycolytic genes regulator
MDKLISLQQRIAPEMTAAIERRYSILRQACFLGPIGRRSLAATLGLQERAVRNELEFLRRQELLLATSQGMSITDEGREILGDLEDYVRKLRGLSQLERKLADWLELERAVVVPGDSDQDESVKKELGRATASYLEKVLSPGMVCAVTGGTTMTDVAAAFSRLHLQKEVLVVPARGGLGEEVEKQANTVAAAMAKGIGGSYRLLHVPDDLGEQALESIMHDPKIEELLGQIKAADLVVHGIGTAQEMAKRRGLSQEQGEFLHSCGAVGEAFGYYFNQKGQIVYTTSSIGLRYEDLANIKKVVAVGGGRSKAAAALAVLFNQYQHVLITDEGAARGMLALGGGDETE